MASAKCSEETEECTRRVFEAVNNNSVSSFISARNTFSEIQLLNSLAQCNEKGETPLAIAIKSNYVSVVKEIVSFLKNALNRNIEEIQLKLTFVINQHFQQIPIKELIDILIHDRYRYSKQTKWLMFIEKIVIESISLTRQDKIILLEVIGTALIIQLNCFGITHQAKLCVKYGLECWRKAMTLRYFPTYGEPLLPKLPNVHVPTVLSSVIFGSAVEVATIEELDLLQQDFQRNYLDDRLPCVKRMVIQALLVSRRISAQEHLGHPLYWLYLQGLLDFANFVWWFEDLTIKPYLFILEQLNGFDPNLLPLASFHVLYQTLDLLSDYFVYYSRELPNSPSGKELNYANLLMIAKLITTIEGNHPPYQMCRSLFEFRVLHVVYRLVFVMNSISSRITSEEQQKWKQFFCDYFRDFPERKATVLHEAIFNNICQSTDHARLQTIKRLLQFGADPNATNNYGQTPLHILAIMLNFTLNGDYSVHLFQALLDAGAHLDTVADDGKTVLCILKKKLEGKAHPYFESLINCVLPLSCYCARVIRRHGIPFEDRLPPRLKKLVSIHNAIEGKQIINHSAFLEK